MWVKIWFTALQSILNLILSVSESNFVLHQPQHQSTASRIPSWSLAYELSRSSVFLLNPILLLCHCQAAWLRAAVTLVVGTTPWDAQELVLCNSPLDWPGFSYQI